MDQVREYLGLIAVLISIGTIIYSWLTSGSSKALKELDELKEDLGEDAEELARDKKTGDAAVIARFQLVEARLIKLESDFQHLPEREQVHRIELAVERLSGALATMDERLKPVSAIAARLQDLEFERAK
ncbi:hypothetical protein ASD44_09745 [Mesorhizobium sp. Root554]|uniref:DUF2730 family protein n=1 Tax=unclassified Mesorhizobium TaxID=325217 RepID=UPI0006FFC1C2|nr:MULTISPECIES: DUF2730 family protein [unclassified Mesorhizobium]KQZ14325.1 hypothetical protein ASD27_09755 [Mesorhizobium sp. Root1471]KQZ36836.1 hypothetical protein ASD44_09745 [Mesorhizobium sp. Root554]